MAVLTLLCWRAVLDRSAGDRGLLTEGEKGPPCSSGRSLDKGKRQNGGVVVPLDRFQPGGFDIIVNKILVRKKTVTDLDRRVG